ncbi:hypothetical protein JRQ81_018259 [Phrynocephalus forsythii]|uniref:Zinc finger B-box domain containing n=1 Tax=Phrynocephalus forsythii TaxID=171643 RepID=A0A9Q0XV67_9SAUR|nr:hypothetical protein JRQ81_018259 [Phrynocephalus forsythii]
MNVNDFVILPGSKTGLSVKLKAKSIKELQMEKIHLELENKEMEKKLQQLQETMSREKQERERVNGYHWKSGQAGLGLQPQLLLQNKENIGKVSSGKVKLRVLKEQDQGNVSEAAKQAVGRKVVPDVAAEKPKVKGKACGQCEIKSALLMCLECGEEYCPGCFARMHQKGALKLHRTTSLQGKPRISVGKLEAAQQFLKATYPEDSNGGRNKEEKKEMNDNLEDRADLSSFLSEVPMYNLEKSCSASSSEVRPESQNGGSLLQGTFDEEVSAKSFQKALNQWRNGNCSQKHKEERSCQAESEQSGTCQVQTSPPVMKKPIEIEFKEDSLTYMEKLLIKKHRRTPVDKLPDSIIEDELILEKALINETQNTCVEKEEEEEEEEENEEDIAITRFEAEEMKKYWTDALQNAPEAIIINSEPSLKIKILEDTSKEESEEAASFVLVEAGSDELADYSGIMSKNEKTEPDIFLAQAGNIATRSPLSSAVGSETCLTFLHNNPEETPRVRAPFSQSERADAACSCSGAEEIVPTTPNKRAVTKEKEPETKKSNSHMSCEQTFSPPKLVPNKPFPIMELPKDCKIELNEALPFTTEASLVASREKPVYKTYRGLEGFFTMDTNCQQVMMDSFPSLHIGSHSLSDRISFSASELWVKHLSLGECADECVVQEVLKKELSRPSSRLGRKNPSLGALPSVLLRESASSKPLSADISLCRVTKPTPCPSPVLEARPTNSAAWPLSRAASEISEIESIDVTEHDDPFWEYSTDQQALADLGDELQSNSDPWENVSVLMSGDFSRHSKMPWQNLSDFHNNNETGDYSKGDTARVYDESHTDDEEDQRDRQQVIELH